MCRISDKNYKNHYACFKCRFAFRRDLTSVCPQCASPVFNVGKDFKAPKKNDIKQWEKVRIMVVELKHLYQNCGCGYHNPNAVVSTLKEAQALAAQRRRFSFASQNWQQFLGVKPS